MSILPHLLGPLSRFKPPNLLMSGLADSSKTNPQPSQIFALKNHGAFCRLREGDEAVIFRLVIAIFGETIQTSLNVIPLSSETVEKYEFTTKDKSAVADYVAKLKARFHENKFDYLEYHYPAGTKEEIYSKIAAWMIEI